MWIPRLKQQQQRAHTQIEYDFGKWAKFYIELPLIVVGAQL